MDEQGEEQRLDAFSLASLTSLGAATKAAHNRDKKRALRERNLLDLSARLATLADDPGAWFSDVVLHLGPQREPVPAHRAILATASPILHALLLSASAASSSQAAGAVVELELPDVDPQTFKMLLRFVYSGALQAGSGLSTDAGLQLLELAERFDVPGLAGICLDRYVRKVISHENAFDLFAETYTKHKQQISIECLYFIEEHFSKLLKHNRAGFRQLPEAVLAEVLKSDRLSIGDEYMLFLALVDWGRAALAREQPDLVPSSLSSSSASSSSASSSSSLSSSSSSPSSLPLPLPLPSATSPALAAALRRRLASLMPHIRFPMMSPQGLEEAEKTGLVPAELLYEAFRHHVLLRDGVVADGEGPDVGDAALSAASFSSSSSSSLLVEEDQTNPRLRRRKYHTYFLWDPSWHGQNIQIEDQGRTARKVKAGWYSLAIGSTGFSTGKHYWEVKVNGQEFSVGVVLKSLPSTQLDNYLAASTDAWAYEAVAQRKRGGVRTAYGEAYGVGDHIGVLLDLEQGHLSFFKNGKSLGPAYTDLPTGTPIFPAIGWRDGKATIVPAWCCSMDL